MAVLNNREIATVDASTNGGTGTYHREPLAVGDDLGPGIKTFARITVEPGTVMGYHQHVGDFELYYILEGEGEYNDNGTLVPARVGDVFRCADGEWHTIKNTGDKDLVFIALIPYTL